MIEIGDPATSERTRLRVDELFRKNQQIIHRQTDRLFAGLMIFQWLGGILIAAWYSPLAWTGTQASIHINVWSALILGGAIASIPVFLAFVEPGKTSTRHVIAVGQMLTSALLIHLTGGRIETHFHVFGSLAFLAFYRDWKVILTATVIVALDHGLRGIFWPESVYGVLSATAWRTAEHAGWVAFEDAFLIYSIRQSLHEMRSVSERQAKLEALNEAFEQKVEERTQELTVEIEESKRARKAAFDANLEKTEFFSRNKAKSEFLSRMSHELRTPLNAILGFGQLLEASNLEEDDKDSVGQILKGGRHLLGLINEVLDIARIESGRLAISPEPVLVRDLLEEAIALVKPLANQRRLSLDWERNECCEQFIQVDRQKLKQVMLNILSNAIKYNHQDGSVGIVCRTTENHHLRIEVTDTGPGISEDRIQRLFTPFDRLGAESSGVEGTGLGLALSQRLVHAMHGQIGAESCLDKGSTFWVEFIIVENRLEDEGEFGGHPEHRISGRPGGLKSLRTILYVEDNLPNLTLVQRIIKRRPGLKLISAMQGRLGLDLAREHAPAIILLDLHLPDMMGIEVLRQLRREPKTRDVPVVVISADATHSQMSELEAEGADAYLTKPININEFLKTLDDLLEAKDRVESCSS